MPPGSCATRCGKQMRLRVAPEILFHIDDSIERGARLSSLIDDSVDSDRRRHVESEPDPE